MNTTPKLLADGTEKIAFHAHRKFQWKGRWYKDGDPIDATEAETHETAFAAWVEHGWVTRQDSASAPAPTAASVPCPPDREQYVVVKQIAWHGITRSPGDTIDFARKGSHSNRDRWLAAGKIRPVAAAAALSEPRTSAVTAAPAPIPQTVSAEIVRQVPWSLIKPSRFNPREDFMQTPAAAAAMAELVASIKANGIIQPLIVRPFPPVNHEETHYELVAGERRWQAANLVGLETVPCLVRDLAKQAAIEQQALENIARRDLNQIEEGQGYKTLMDDAGFTVPQICQRTGKSEATIYSRLKLLECPPGIRQAVIEGRLKGSTADLVAREEDNDFRFALMDAILHPESRDGVDDGSEWGGKPVLSFRATKSWISDNKPRFAREAEWKKRQKDSHVFKDAAQVLSVDDSMMALYSGGNVRQSQDYVKPDDQCFDDADGRTFKQLAEAAGVALPKPVLAREPVSGAPVVLLPREATQQVLAPIIPEAGAYQRKQQEAERERQAQAARADELRKENFRQVQARAVAVAIEVKNRPLDGDDEEEILRFAVGAQLAVIANDEDDLAAALGAMGCPVEKREMETVATPEWREDYLRGCDTRVLHAWLVWFAIHDLEFYNPTVDEDRLVQAEVLLGLREPAPQASEAADGEEVAA